MGHRGRNRIGVLAVAIVAVAALSGCLQVDVQNLADDALAGRVKQSTGSATARSYILDVLRESTIGPNTAATGDGAYESTNGGLSGTSLVGVLPGSDLADEYVMIGAHYDGGSCDGQTAADAICNAATDNATGVAILLDLIRSYDAGGITPRRSIIFAFWDGGEDTSFNGAFRGSNYYGNHPLVPLEQTVAYVNLDVQGANLRPGAATSTFALGAASGGASLIDAVDAAADPGTLDLFQLSSTFNLEPSDAAEMISHGIPSVSLTDSTGPCVNTVDDEYAVVDFDKLAQQVQTTRRLLADLTDRDDPPTFTPGLPVATYDDAVNLQTVLHRIVPDLQTLPPAQLATFMDHLADVDAIVAAGSAAFTSTTAIALIQAVGPMFGTTVANGPCSGFLPSE